MFWNDLYDKYVPENKWGFSDTGTTFLGRVARNLELHGHSFLLVDSIRSLELTPMDSYRKISLLRASYAIFTSQIILPSGRQRVPNDIDLVK